MKRIELSMQLRKKPLSFFLVKDIIEIEGEATLFYLYYSCKAIDIHVT